MQLRLPAFLTRKPTLPPTAVALPAPPPVPQDASNDDEDADVVDSADLGVVDLNALPNRLRAVFKDPRYQPPTPPAVAMELMALSRTSEVDLVKAEALFRRDPMLTARVLKVARSPLYGSASVPTIKDAIVRLGARRLNHVVLEAALELRVFRSAVWGHWMERVRRHSTAVGHIASQLAHLGDIDADQAFIAGLMHDIGTAAAIGAIGDRHSDFADIDPIAIAQAFDELHLEVGAIVAEVWQMSAEVKMVIAGHHHVQLKKSPLLAVIVLAEAFANDAGFNISAEIDPFCDDDLVWARQMLDLDDAKIARLGHQLAPIIATL